jgi:predicted permease
MEGFELILFIICLVLTIFCAIFAGYLVYRIRYAQKQIKGIVKEIVKNKNHE